MRRMNTDNGETHGSVEVQDRRDDAATRLATRREIVGAGIATATSIGLALSGATAFRAEAAAQAAPHQCDERVHDVLATALVAERIAVTLYYTGLTAHIVKDRSGPRNTGVADGDRAAALTYLQATLDQEEKHVRLLERQGAISPFHKFHFPTTAFEHLGVTNRPGTYFWTVDHLETALAGIYIAAIKRLSTLRRDDLATLAARILGVECQHRTLYRALSRDDPADNITLEVNQFTCAGDASVLLRPFLTGQGFHSGPTRVISLPTAAQLARVVHHTTGV